MGKRCGESKRLISIGALIASLAPVWVLFILTCLCVAMYGLVYYNTARRPAPKPYPGAEVPDPLISIGAGRREYRFEYTVNHSLDGVQEYYEEQMNEYCVDDDWQFSPTKNACVGYAECRVASCDIANSQWFLIYLRSVTETRTNVVYIHETSDP